MKQLFEVLQDMDACEEAVEMSKQYKTLEEAWNSWPRGDHMLWIFRRAKNYDLQSLTLAKGHCANTVRHLMKDKRSITAVDIAIKFGEGTATCDDLNAADAAAAAYAADAAADAADDDAAAAYAAAADAADAAATYAADAYAADAAAAYAAADAAYAADARAKARKENQQLTANICRKYLPIPIL